MHKKIGPDEYVIDDLKNFRFTFDGEDEDK